MKSIVSTMLLKPVRLLALTIGSATLAFGAAHAQSANKYPDKPVRMVVPFAPGGPADVMARVLAKEMSERMNQSVIVDNRPGAGGNIGTDVVAKSAADGYSVGLIAISSLTISPHLFAKLPYDGVKDFTPITMVGIAKGAVLAHPSAPFSDLRGMVDYAKANPGKISYASSGIGTAPHLAAEYLQVVTGIKMTHVPYKGTAPAAQDLLAGVIPVGFESSLTASGRYVADGRLKAIGITSATRASLLPDVPTVAEQGYPGFDVPTAFGLVGPAGMPAEIVFRLSTVVADSMKSAEAIERFAGIGAEPKADGPELFSRFLASETERWGALIRQVGITLD
ncbi:MAG TPA: tripartite tricarboxylate transporter substrate binding protein [Burkholderiaceae bacterium]|nr:tripartite tricarboxylate transporter substrate binding protein [Burkholderiaceae bacterium]